MTRGNRRPVAVFVAAVLAVLLVGSAAAATGTLASDATLSVAPAGDGVSFASVVDDPATYDDPVTSSTTDAPVLTEAATARDDSTIHLTQTLHRLPDRPGQYEADNRYRIPDQVVELEVTVPAEATAFQTRGFSAEGDGRYVWDGETAGPRLGFRMPANETVDRDDPLSGPGRYLFVDTGEWGIVQRPPLGHSWGWRGSPTVRFDRTLAASPGAAGSDVAYLGEYEERRHTAHDQRFRLVVPTRSDMAEEPATVFGTLANTSDALRVGDRDEEVFLVAAPTADVQWGARGVQIGDTDVWVRDSERVDDVENVWVHEYVHTRQDYQTTGETRWFTEAAATYYAALYALEGDRVGFDTFRNRLRMGTHGRHENVVLADTGTWQSHPDYYVGPLVLGDVDRRTRAASSSERALHTVFARMNDADGSVGAGQFYDFVADAGGADEANLTRRYAESTERPTLWNVSTHQAVFGPIPARIDYRLAAGVRENAIRASGPYRNRTLRYPYVVVPGERFSIDVVVENTGGTAGDYDVHLRNDEVTLDRRTGRIDPGSSVTVTTNGSLDRPGEYELRVGGERVPVTVWDPVEAEVTGLRTDASEDVRPGDPVTVTVTVRNDAGWPGERDVRVTADDGAGGRDEGDRTVAERTVRLDGESERTVTATVTFDEPGTYQIGVADSDVTPRTVRVAADRGPLPAVGPVAAALAGVAVLLAMVVAALLARRR